MRFVPAFPTTATTAGAVAAVRLLLLVVLALVSGASRVIAFESDAPSATTSNSNSRQICSVPNGLEVVRLVSGKTRSVFRTALEDAELLREAATEAMTNGGVSIEGGFTTLQALAATLDWEARGLPNGTTTVDAALGYTDDRPDRRVDRYVSLLNEPLVGTKQTDMAIAETLANILPWIVDRQSKEDFWWRDHQNGHSEGPYMEEKVVDALYAGAWINTYGDALWYYPPLSVFGHPLTIGDIYGTNYDSHIEGNGVVFSFFPGNNDRAGEAFLSAPYPDIAVPGLSMITAGAPLFFTGEFQGYTYNSTFLATIGVDITISSMSGMLDELDGTLTNNSFALLVDADFYAIVISQPTVEKLFPPMTGMEEKRITYDMVDGTKIVQDRRNQTYLVSDTIVQPLTDLGNADWKALQQDIMQLEPGERDYTIMNITMTGDTEPTLVYAMFERWPHVADWAMISFAPVHQVDNAVHVGFAQDSIQLKSPLKTTTLRDTVEFLNQGTLDVMVSYRNLPDWILIFNQEIGGLDEKTLVKAGTNLTLELTFLTERLLSGTTTSLVTLIVEDAGYSECFYSQTYSLDVTIEKEQNNGADDLGAGPIVGILVGVLFVIAALVFVFMEYNKRKGDSIWKVEKSDLKFDDPPEVVGRGTFGLVLLANYRGTNVAVKRVIPPTKSTKTSSKNADQFSRMGGASSTDHILEQASVKQGSGQIGTASGSIGKTSKGGTMGTMSKTQPSGFFALGTKSGNGSMALNFLSGKKSDAAKLSKLKNDFIQEMRTLAKLRHPSIMTVMGAVIGKNEDPMLIMEYCEHGSLYDLFHNVSMILEGEILLPILQDITRGLRFLHAAKINHADLKAANVLVDSSFRGKVADFGLSQKERLLRTSNAVYGTPYWMAPELLRGESCNTTKSDVYSFGILLYETLTRSDPYQGEDYEEVMRLVKDRTVCKRPPIPEKCDPQIHSMMKDALVDDASCRPTFEELDERLKRIDAKTLLGDRVPATNATVSLFDIFPKHIAEALRDGKKIEAERKEVVTIFFCDIIGFTTISSTLDPLKVAKLLDRLYGKFDNLSHKHDVFKVETIGDAYMAVTNLVKDQHEDHAKRIAAFAVDAIRAANETLVDLDDTSKGFINIRVGFHSGPCVADVVGNRSPRYCLFGDTVNTASRMESISKANCIQCSERSAELLQEQNSPFPIFPRGQVNVKGKGDMYCFWVNAKPADDTKATTTKPGSRYTRTTNGGSQAVLDAVLEHEQSERSIGIGIGVDASVDVGAGKDDLDLVEQGCMSDISV